MLEYVRFPISASMLTGLAFALSEITSGLVPLPPPANDPASSPYETSLPASDLARLAMANDQSFLVVARRQRKRAVRHVRRVRIVLGGGGIEQGLSAFST